MSHIPLNNNLFGIVSLFDYRKDTAEMITGLAQILLRGESSLTEVERELIATYVSYLNQCEFCYNSHKAITCNVGGTNELVDAVTSENDPSGLISDKLKCLLKIAGAAQKSGKSVSKELVEAARAVGATDREIHDTVLIAALFCLCNRYVDGLATLCPPCYDFPANVKFNYTQN